MRFVHIILNVCQPLWNQFRRNPFTPQDDLYPRFQVQNTEVGLQQTKTESITQVTPRWIVLLFRGMQRKSYINTLKTCRLTKQIQNCGSINTEPFYYSEKEEYRASFWESDLLTPADISIYSKIGLDNHFISSTEIHYLLLWPLTPDKLTTQLTNR